MRLMQHLVVKGSGEKEQRKDKITNFEDLNNYQLHIEDELKVDSYLNKKKK